MIVNWKKQYLVLLFTISKNTRKTNHFAFGYI